MLRDPENQKPRRPPIQREHQLQKAVKQFARDAIDLPPAQFLFMAMDASLNATQNQRARAVERGEIQGRPDTMWSILGLPPIWLELKTLKGVVSPQQTALILHLIGLGHYAAVARSVEDVRFHLHAARVPLRRNAHLIAADLDLKVAARIAKAEERASGAPAKKSPRSRAQPRYTAGKRMARRMNLGGMG